MSPAVTSACVNVYPSHHNQALKPTSTNPFNSPSGVHPFVIFRWSFCNVHMFLINLKSWLGGGPLCGVSPQIRQAGSLFPITGARSLLRSVDSAACLSSSCGSSIVQERGGKKRKRERERERERYIYIYIWPRPQQQVMNQCCPTKLGETLNHYISNQDISKWHFSACSAV